MNLFQFRDKLKALDLPKAAEESIRLTSPDMLKLQKEQLSEGKTRTGANIFPGYLDDPFFKTKKAAQAYSDWKDRITPNVKRAPGVPNLFITGQLVYDPLTIAVKRDKVEFNIDSSIGGKIFSKYGSNVVGLNADKKPIYNGVLSPVFIGRIRDQIGLSNGAVSLG